MAAGSDTRLRSVSVSAPTVIAHDLGRLLGTLSVKADIGGAKRAHPGFLCCFAFLNALDAEFIGDVVFKDVTH